MNKDELKQFKKGDFILMNFGCDDDIEGCIIKKTTKYLDVSVITKNKVSYDNEFNSFPTCYINTIIKRPDGYIRELRKYQNISN